ncbi:hypothetical protein ABBQ32_009527 [Trebouxia sp. C0010 RCD-2024]
MPEPLNTEGGLYMCLVAANLNDTRKGAQRAFNFLGFLLDRELLPAEQVAQHEAELAHSNGLCCCSALICPSPHY